MTRTITRSAALCALAGLWAVAPASARPGIQEPAEDRRTDRHPYGPMGQEPLAVHPDEVTSVTGQVASIDRETGRIELDTADGLLSVKFSPEAVRDIEVGDEVTVAFALPEGDAPAASPFTEPESTREVPGAQPAAPEGASEHKQ